MDTLDRSEIRSVWLYTFFVLSCSVYVGCVLRRRSIEVYIQIHVAVMCANMQWKVLATNISYVTQNGYHKIKEVK